MTYSELALRFTAQVARTLGLPHHDVRAAETMTDKLAQRRALAAAGVPVPAFAEIRGPATSTAPPPRSASRPCSSPGAGWAARWWSGSPALSGCGRWSPRRGPGSTPTSGCAAPTRPSSWSSNCGGALA
ncbi:hypothetical protein [Dactylosporangium cerinum]